MTLPSRRDLVETGGEIEVRSFDGAALSEDDLFV